VALTGMVSEPTALRITNGSDYFFWGSWALALAYATLISRLHHPLIGAFLVPAIVLFMGSSSYLLHHSDGLGATREYSGVSPTFLSLAHAVPALVSVVSLALAFCASAVFLIVERSLKKKGSQVMAFSGPNLQTLDRLNRRCVQVGFAAITLVILSGGLWAVVEHKSVFTLDTSVVSGLAVWVLLALILHVRMVLGWSPKRVSRITVVVTGAFFASVFIVMALSGRVNHASLWL
jgi:ABC-type transport system involved in cytochrome c biogenesis permease subunit